MPPVKLLNFGNQVADIFRYILFKLQYKKVTLLFLFFVITFNIIRNVHFKKYLNYLQTICFRDVPKSK